MDSEGAPSSGSEDRESARTAPVAPAPESANASGLQLIRNAVYSYANYIIGVVTSLVLTRALLHHLGPAAFGLWGALLALITYLQLLDVGVATAAVQRIARLVAVDDREGLADLIRTAWFFFAGSALAAIVITVALAPFVGDFLHLGNISTSLAGSTLILLGSFSALFFLNIVPNAVLYGSGRNDRLSQIALVSLVAAPLVQVAILFAGAGLVAVAVVQAAGMAVTLAISASIMGRISKTSIRQGHFRRSLLRQLLNFGGIQAVVGLGGVVSFQIDALIIGLILPIAEVAPYNIALNTSNFTRSLSTQATNLLLPTYAHFDVVGDRDRQATYFFRAVMICLVISVPIIVALIAFGEPILQLWLGTVPPKTYEIVVALGAVNALQLPGTQCFLFLTGVGRNRPLAVFAIIGAVFNLAGSVVATYLLGPIGPAIGSIPVVLVLDFTVLPLLVCRYLGVPFRRYMATALAPVLPVAVVASAVALIFVHLGIGKTGLMAIVSASVVCCAAWLTLFVTISRFDPDIRGAVWKRIKNRRQEARPR